MTLSGKVWPVHSPPKPGESLTSWQTRISVMHMQYPSTFFLRTIPSHFDSWKQDLDVRCPEHIIQAIADRNCQSIDTVGHLTMAPLMERFCPTIGQSSALPRWISPAFIRRKTKHHYGLRVCRECLKEFPYYRLYWRFMFFFACPIHHALMVEECPECQSSISSHKIYTHANENLPLDALAFCHRCGYDFRDGASIAVDESDANFVAQCCSAIDNGHIQWQGIGWNYSHLFFQGVRLIAKGLLSHNMRPYLLQGMTDPVLTAFSVARSHDEIEFFPVELLRHIFNCVHCLLENWPARFLDECANQNSMYSDWISPRDVVPYWIYSVLKLHFLGKHEDKTRISKKPVYVI